MTTKKTSKREFDTVVEILRAASKGAKKSELIHRCKLTSSVLAKFLSAMTELNLLVAKDVGEIHYKTTPEGLNLLHTYHKLKWMLWGGTLDYMLVGMLGRLKVNRKTWEKTTIYIS